MDHPLQVSLKINCIKTTHKYFPIVGTHTFSMLLKYCILHEDQYTQLRAELSIPVSGYEKNRVRQRQKVGDVERIKAVPK